MAVPFDERDGMDSNPEISFREAEDYVEQRRQKEILDAVQSVAQTEVETKEEFERGEIDIGTRREIVRTAVERLIRETEQLMVKAGARRLLTEEPLGTITIQPPADLVSFVNNGDTKIWGDSSVEPKDAAAVYGVRGFLNASATFSATWSVRADIPHKGPQPVTSSAVTRMPISISMDAFEHVRAFLSETNLEIDPKLEDYDGGEEPGL